jgi:hypothetical protein
MIKTKKINKNLCSPFRVNKLRLLKLNTYYFTEKRYYKYILL